MNDPLIGHTLGDYLIENRIGQGGMGVVYGARQISLDRAVAIKILPAELCADREYVDRFLREARAAAQLNHPNIIQVFDAGVAENIYFIVMEFVDGRNLSQTLREHGAFAEREALHVIQQASVGLAFAHSMGIVHRDVKPENIMATRSGLVKIGDLGLAKWKPNEYEIALTATGSTMGTPFYIAPEQIRGAKDIDARADVYSLGMTLFHLLAGRPAFGEGTAAEIMACHLSLPLPSLRSLRPEISADTARLVAAMTAKDPADRIQGMDEVAENLAMMLGHSSARTPRRGLRAPAEKKRQGTDEIFSRILSTGIRGVFAGIVGLLIALAVILVWKKARPRPAPPALSPPSADLTPSSSTNAPSRASSKPKPSPPKTAVAPIPPAPKAAAPTATPPKTTPAPSHAAAAPQETPPRAAAPKAPREPARAPPPSAAVTPPPAPRPEEKSPPQAEARPATRDLTLQGNNIFTSLVISPQADPDPSRRTLPRWGRGVSRWDAGARGAATWSADDLFDLVAADGPRRKAKTLLRVEFLARDAELARRFLRQLDRCVSAVLEITPIKVSDDARDLVIEVRRMLTPWGRVSWAETDPESNEESGFSAEDSSGHPMFFGSMKRDLERREILRKDTDWKYATRDGGKPKTWARDGAGGGGFDRANTPLNDASNPNRSAFRLPDASAKKIALDVLPELRQLAELARERPQEALHHGWILEVGRGSGEARFAGTGDQAPRLRLLFGKKDAPPQ